MGKKYHVLSNAYTQAILLLISSCIILLLIIPSVNESSMQHKTLAISVIGALFTALGWSVSFFSGNYLKKEELNIKLMEISSSKDEVRQQMITNNIAPMRQSWINDLRTKSSLFFHKADLNKNMIISYNKKHLKLKDANFSQETIELKLSDVINTIQLNINELKHLSIYLDLLLPFKKLSKNGSVIKDELLAEELRHKIHAVIKASEDVMPRHIDISTYETTINDLVKDGVNIARNLLKQEWDETRKIDLD